MLTIEAIQIYIKIAIAFYQVCPSIGSVALKSPSILKRSIDKYLITGLVGLDGDIFTKCCMFLTYFHEV